MLDGGCVVGHIYVDMGTHIYIYYMGTHIYILYIINLPIYIQRHTTTGGSFLFLQLLTLIFRLHIKCM